MPSSSPSDPPWPLTTAEESEWLRVLVRVNPVERSALLRLAIGLEEAAPESDHRPGRE